MDTLEKERDFYFGKLRDIEVLCQEHEKEGLPVVQQITDILYATEVWLLCTSNIGASEPRMVEAAPKLSFKKRTIQLN